MTPQAMADLKARRLRAELRDDLERLLGPTPPQLFHYTTVQGLQGIVQSGKLWATEARYLNDSTELSYGCDVLAEATKEALGSVRDPAHQVAVRSLSEGIAQMMEDSRIFVTCFCEGGDLLSQWRGYGAVGGGYAIGFDGSALGNKSARMEKGDLVLQRVIYDRGQQRSLIDHAIKTMVSKMPEVFGHYPPKQAVEMVFPFGYHVGLHFLSCISCFKHSSFSEEKEWRLIHATTSTGVQGLKYRSGYGLMVPYIALDVRRGEEGNQHLPICSINHGPASHPNLTKQSLKGFLSSSGYPDIKIDGSEIPFRV